MIKELIEGFNETIETIKELTFKDFVDLLSFGIISYALIVILSILL